MNFTLLNFVILSDVLLIVYSFNVETLLLKEILETRNYNKYIRKPTVNRTEPVKVDIEIALHTVRSLDMKNQIMTTSVGIKMSWTDEFLTWNKSLYGEKDKISAPISKIWQPDVFLTNYADKSDIFEDENKVVSIYSNGLVERHDVIEVKTYCFVDSTWYPFETETCTLNFAAQNLDNKEQMIRICLPDNFFNLYKSNGEWLITKPDKIRNYTTTIENSSGRNFSGVVLQIEMERGKTYYIWKFLVPTISITLINTVTFCLPVTSAAKVTLSTFVLFGLTGMIELFNDSLPSSSDKISCFGSLLWWLLGISGLILTFNVIIIVIFKCGTCERLCSIWNCEKKGNNSNEDPEKCCFSVNFPASCCAKERVSNQKYEPLDENQTIQEGNTPRSCNEREEDTQETELKVVLHKEPPKEHGSSPETESIISTSFIEIEGDKEETEQKVVNTHKEPTKEQRRSPESENYTTILKGEEKSNTKKDNKEKEKKEKKNKSLKNYGLYVACFIVMLAPYVTVYAYFINKIFNGTENENVCNIIEQ